MKTKLCILSTLIFSAFIFAGSAQAGDQEKMVIQLKTNDFEVAETDISNLAIGESETIITESGKTIDLLRTADGVEIYVDGELMDMPSMDGHDVHFGDGQKIHKQIIIECEVDSEGDSEATCNDNMVFYSAGDWDIEGLHEVGSAHKVFIKRMHTECTSDVEGECEELNVWIADGEDLDLVELHENFDLGELHEAGEGHKFIRIHKLHADGDVEFESRVEKIIIIEKD